MDLRDVKRDGTVYLCRSRRGERTATHVRIVANHVDDGACLIGEIHEDGDCTSRLIYTEACELSEVAK